MTSSAVSGKRGNLERGSFFVEILFEGVVVLKSKVSGEFKGRKFCATTLISIIFGYLSRLSFFTLLLELTLAKLTIQVLVSVSVDLGVASEP